MTDNWGPIVWVFCVAASGVGGCAGGPTDRPTSRVAEPAAVETAEPDWFVDRAQAAGLDFVHTTGRSGRFYQPEILGPGAALFDYDNDGDLDVYLVQGQMLGAPVTPDAPGSPPAPVPVKLKGRLYRNELGSDGGPDALRFTDVTDASGIDARGYGMGVAAGDLTNDGCVDLYLTHYGPNQLYRNNCDGTFTDVSHASGTADPGWSVPAALLDVDRDGWLDLFVGNYLVYDIDQDVTCYTESGSRDYCRPQRYRAQPDRLYRNRGDGTFVDVTADAGLAATFGPGLGIATADFDGDGWTDMFVANDQQDNQLWLNQQDGTFRDLALVSGTAVGAAGERKADMGVDAGDFDNDGDEDLVITELTGEGSTLYVNDGTGAFEERSGPVGLRLASLPFTGFGAGWIDFDNDGWLDILEVNGFVNQNLDALGPDNPFPMQQPNLLLRNLSGQTFDDVTGRAGAVFELSEVSRGAAFGDIDNDGDTDVVIANAEGPVRLLVNDIGTRHHWIGLRLVGGRPARDMLGARVAVLRSDGSTLWRRARADGSYASANDPRVLVGLGEQAKAPDVRVMWPSGRVEEWRDVPIDQYTWLTEGEGR